MTELEAIDNSIEQWTFYAGTDVKRKRDYPPIMDGLKLLDNCYLCEYSRDVSERRSCDATDGRPRCQPCPYYKKYGFCSKEGAPFEKWVHSYNKDRRPFALAFLDQLKVLTCEARRPKAEKPKLRHGDCSLSRMGEPAVFIGNGREAVAYYEDGHSEPCGEWQNGTYAIDGRGFRFNAFADLQVLSEPLEEFEYQGYAKKTIRLESDGDIDLGSLRRIRRKDIHDFILNLCRMEAKMKMDEAGGKE